MDDAPNISYFIKHYPQLETIYREVLRRQMSNSLMRHGNASTRSGGLILQKDRNVIATIQRSGALIFLNLILTAI